VSELLTGQGRALLECLMESPAQFCKKVEKDLQAVADGLMDADVPSSENRAHQLEFAHDIMYCWMICEAYCAFGPVRSSMLRILRRDKDDMLAEGDSRRKQLNDAKLMFSKKGKYKLGAIRFSPSITQMQKDEGAMGREQDLDGADSPARLQWLQTQQKAMAMNREQVLHMYAMWGKSGYMDRRLEDRARLDRMVTGKEAQKRSYYAHVMSDLLRKHTSDAAPSELTNELLQIRSKEAWSVLQLHAQELLLLEEGRPADSFSSSILTDFAAMGHMMEEACRCGRSLYDAEKLVSQYIPLPEWTPEPPTNT